MKDSFKEKVFKCCAITMVLGTLIVGIILAWPDYQRSLSIKAKQRELSVRIEEKKAEIEAVKKKQMRFRTDRDFVEAIARQNNRVLPGELVFIFEKD